jgi:hypothetical protein
MTTKERVYQMATEQGFNISQIKSTITLEKDNKIITKKGFRKVYSYLYSMKRKAELNYTL